MDPVWEEKYSSGHEQRYPWDCVVSFVFQNVPRDLLPENINILELGFGTGANLWFAAREGFSVSGIEGSESAVQCAKKKFLDLGYEGDLRKGDFCQLPFGDNFFHLVIDRASLTHVGLSEQKRAIDEVYRVLKKKGKFMYNPYSNEHSSSKSGNLSNDGLSDLPLV
jgi:ubiquinone/menaquinone biosynthesis C-methylase UbiE